MKRIITATLAAAVAATVVVAAPAAAAGDVQRQPEPPLAVSIGEAGTTVPAESLFGTPRIVPGDRFVRGLDVTTTSPGTLTVQIVNVRAGAEPGGSVDTAWERDLTLTWTTPDGGGSGTWHDLKRAGDVTIAVLPAAAGEVHRVTLGYAMPWEATSGNGTHPTAEFDVRLAMDGTEPAAPPKPDKDPRSPKLVDGGIPWLTSTTAVAWTGVGLLALTALALVAAKARRRNDA